MNEINLKISAADLAMIHDALVPPQVRALIELSNRIELQARAQAESPQAMPPQADASLETPSA